MTELTSLPLAEGQRDTPDHRDPVRRLSRLLDPGSLRMLGNDTGSNVRTGRGLVKGTRVVAYCTDGSTSGGAIGAVGCRDIARAIELAVHEDCPVIGLWHSGGAKLAEGVRAMDGIGIMFSAMIAASGEVPQISLVLGPAAGGAAYGPALTDIVIMAPGGRMFVTGPDVVRSVTGEQIDMEGLGGREAHGRKSGVAHVVADSEDDAYARTREITWLLAYPGTIDPAAVRDGEALRSILPDNPRRAYDVRPLLRGLLDRPGEADSLQELQPKWAANLVVGFGRIGGRAVGVVANNPLRKGGCLDSLSAEKAARFVRTCDSFGLPLLVLVDVPGYLPGVRQEWEGVIRRGAKLLYAFGEATVPRVTLITRKSYGGAYIAMNSRALGASTVFAWPDAEVAVMGAEAAVGILHRKTLAATPPEEAELVRSRLIEEHKRTAGGAHTGVSIGVIDEIIDPAHTPAKLAEALATVPFRRGRHGNIPL